EIRESELAVLRKQQELQEKGIDINSEQGQQILNNTRQVVLLNAEAEKAQKQIDTISNGIGDAFEKAFETQGGFGSKLKVFEHEVALTLQKALVIDPLKQQISGLVGAGIRGIGTLLGGNSTTPGPAGSGGGLGDLISKLFGGGGNPIGTANIYVTNANF